MCHCSGLNAADIDLTLLKVDKGVDIALTRAKLWAKYAKDITSYIEKRANMEAEFSKSLAKLANSVQQTITEDSFLPFQSIYVMALSHDINAGSKSLATWHVIQTQKFIEPLNVRRTEHEKIRKHLKDTWAKELKRMVSFFDITLVQCFCSKIIHTILSSLKLISPLTMYPTKCTCFGQWKKYHLD